MVGRGGLRGGFPLGEGVQWTLGSDFVTRVKLIVLAFFFNELVVGAPFDNVALF